MYLKSGSVRATDASWYICGANLETIIHTLRDYPQAHQVWSSLGLLSPSFLQEKNLFLWIKNNSIKLQGTLFLISCWFIWKTENDESFSYNTCPLWRILNQIKSLVKHKSKVFCDSSLDKVPRLVSWKPPPEIVMKPAAKLD